MASQDSSVDPGRTYAGESAGERLARQRQQFMDAGFELFGTAGYRATTVRMLCKEAELTDRYFYKNFQDTEDLLAALYTESLDRIQDQVVQAIDRAQGPGNLEKVVLAGLDAFFKAFENPRMARVCWLEILGVSPRIDALYTARIQQFADLLVRVAQGLLPPRTVVTEETRILAIALVGAVSQSAAFWLLSNYRAQRKTLVSANARLLRGAVSTLLAESPGRKSRA